MNRYYGWAEQGSVLVDTGGNNSVNEVQGSFPGCTVTIYLAGTTNKATIYQDNLSPPTSQTNPFLASASGYWFFYAASGRYDVNFSGTGITSPFTLGDVAGLPLAQVGTLGSGPTQIPTSRATDAGALALLTDQNSSLWVDDGTQWVAVNGQIYNVKDFGAKGDGTTDDTTSIQAAINAAVAIGGATVWCPPGNYKISVALTISMGVSAAGIWFRGSSTGGTTITQSNSGNDIFQVGTTGQEYADYIHFSDFKTSGGHYAFNMNNTLIALIERIDITGAVVGLYFQGTNERGMVRDCDIGASTHAIWAGNTNGGTGSPALDLPEMQKYLFDHIRIAGTTSGAAILITAGILGSQQVSGGNSFHQIRTESNQQNIFEIHFSTDTWIDGWTTEDSPASNNTYDALTAADGSNVFLSNSRISKSSPNNFAHYVNVTSGSLLAVNLTLAGGAAATVDIATSGPIGLVNCAVTGSSSLTFNNTTIKAQSQLWGVRDNSGNLIVWSDATLSAITADPASGGVAVGTLMGNLRLFGNLGIGSMGGSAAPRPLTVITPVGVSVQQRLQSDSASPVEIEFQNGVTLNALLRVNSTSCSIFNANGVGGDNNGIHVMSPAVGGTNLGLGTSATADFGGGWGVLAIRKTSTPPTTNPTNAGCLYVDSTGNLKYRGSSGTVTTIAVP